ncbi:glycine N-acyltransferase-like protein 3 [Stegostoma tigrinum]|uniref:glycine N-acyltransferase-like protein 3 n=1 Tax=Stegostoma tigrinum TaxID=3053191 RepID=UPI00202B9F46|nr:glycine N-acyltransferase-like protein 3 [Stegostoma tigrinum]
MFLLLTEEKLLTLEKILKNYLPAAIKTYGTILSINRVKIPDLEVIVDSWPDFNAVICRPCEKEETSKETEFTLTVFSRDQSSLHKLLMDDNIVNWKTRFMFGGIDRKFLELMKAVVACKKSTISFTSRSYTMVLQDPKDLLDITSEQAYVASRISPLDMSHAEIVNRNWKFGTDDNGLKFVKNIIANFPSYCILDETDNPVSWLLTYPYGAMGLLYTLPEHRRKGYAKLLVTKMVKFLQNLGYPIYCFVEDENSRSYQLFQKLGFNEAPEIHAIRAWCQPS